MSRSTIHIALLSCFAATAVHADKELDVGDTDRRGDHCSNTLNAASDAPWVVDASGKRKLIVQTHPSSNPQSYLFQLVLQTEGSEPYTVVETEGHYNSRGEFVQPFRPAGAWSADGRSILYFNKDQTLGWLQEDLSTKPVSVQGKPPLQTSWIRYTDDRRFFVFPLVRGGTLYAVRLDTKTGTLVSRRAPALLPGLVSPDGQRVAFVAVGCDKAYRPFRVELAILDFSTGEITAFDHQAAARVSVESMGRGQAFDALLAGSGGWSWSKAPKPTRLFTVSTTSFEHLALGTRMQVLRRTARKSPVTGAVIGTKDSPVASGLVAATAERQASIILDTGASTDGDGELVLRFRSALDNEMQEMTAESFDVTENSDLISAANELAELPPPKPSYRSIRRLAFPPQTPTFGDRPADAVCSDISVLAPGTETWTSCAVPHDTEGVEDPCVSAVEYVFKGEDLYGARTRWSCLDGKSGREGDQLWRELAGALVKGVDALRRDAGLGDGRVFSSNAIGALEGWGPYELLVVNAELSSVYYVARTALTEEVIEAFRVLGSGFKREPRGTGKFKWGTPLKKIEKAARKRRGWNVRREPTCEVFGFRGSCLKVDNPKTVEFDTYAFDEGKLAAYVEVREYKKKKVKRGRSFVKVPDPMWPSKAHGSLEKKHGTPTLAAPPYLNGSASLWRGKRTSIIFENLHENNVTLTALVDATRVSLGRPFGVAKSSSEHIYNWLAELPVDQQTALMAIAERGRPLNLLTAESVDSNEDLQKELANLRDPLFVRNADMSADGTEETILFAAQAGAPIFAVVSLTDPPQVLTYERLDGPVLGFTGAPPSLVVSCDGYPSGCVFEVKWSKTKKKPVLEYIGD